MTGDVVDFPKARRRRPAFTSIGTAADAVVAGMTPAAAGADPLLGLVDQYFAIVDEVNSPGLSQERCDQIFPCGEALVLRLVDTVPTTAAGILALLRLLHHITDVAADGDEDGNWCDNRDLRLINSIAAGVERLVAGGAS
jgi:hypothetical protein